MLQVPNDWYGPHFRPAALSVDVRAEPGVGASTRPLLKKYRVGPAPAASSRLPASREGPVSTFAPSNHNLAVPTFFPLLAQELRASTSTPSTSPDSTLTGPSEEKIGIL